MGELLLTTTLLVQVVAGLGLPGAVSGSGPSGSPPPPAPGPAFHDATTEAGLDFVHWNGMSGEHYFTEMTGQGGALFDYDGDGDLDLYLVQGRVVGPGKTMADGLFPYSGPIPPIDRLYRNDLIPGESGKLSVRLVDVTAASGIAADGYGMGIATGDVDNDGAVDLYLTSYGPNQLWRNRGDGTFEAATEVAGVDDPRWSVSASFLDFDRDGWLDLYVVNYVDYSVENNIHCYAPSSRRDYCGPSAFAGVPDSLFRNRGDGTFEDVSARSGIGRVGGAGLGVVAADLDRDGLIDLYVANDGQPNFLWRNRGDGSFSDEALLAGVAVNRRGEPEASMGVDAGDFDNDGDPDLFLTHLAQESNTLYVNQGGGLFDDRSIESGLAAPSLPFTSFGTRWIDLDNDSWLDLLVVNGAVRIQESLAREGDLYPLDQTQLLFRNLDGRRFETVTHRGGDSLSLAEVSRGAAFGDIDLDGDSDVLICNNNGPARLLLNRWGDDSRWSGVRLLEASGRDALGAEVEIARSEEPRLWRRVGSDGSYASASDPRVLAGLGQGSTATSIRTLSPRGERQEWRQLAAAGRYLVLRSPRQPEPPPPKATQKR